MRVLHWEGLQDEEGPGSRLHAALLEKEWHRVEGPGWGPASAVYGRDDRRCFVVRHTTGMQEGTTLLEMAWGS